MPAAHYGIKSAYPKSSALWINPRHKLCPKQTSIEMQKFFSTQVRREIPFPKTWFMFDFTLCSPRFLIVHFRVVENWKRWSFVEGSRKLGIMHSMIVLHWNISSFPPPEKGLADIISIRHYYGHPIFLMAWKVFLLLQNPSPHHHNFPGDVLLVWMHVSLVLGRLKLVHFPGVILCEMLSFHLMLEPRRIYLQIVQTYNNCLVQRHKS